MAEEMDGLIKGANTAHKNKTLQQEKTCITRINMSQLFVLSEV